MSTRLPNNISLRYPDTTANKRPDCWITSGMVKVTANGKTVGVLTRAHLLNNRNGIPLRPKLIR